MNEAPGCGFVDCEGDAVASRAVRGTCWFASHSSLAANNGDESRWEVGGTVLPVDILMTIHVCAQHNAVTLEVPT